MLQYDYYLPGSFVLESFVGGLKPEIRSFVKAFKPTSIASAIEYARLQEENIEVNTMKVVN